MTYPMLAAFLLNFSGVAGTIIRLMGYDNISPVSQKLSIPLILGGIVASFGAIYCLVTTQGWLAGLAIWFVSGLILAAIAKAIAASWDGILSILATVSLLAGSYLFYADFILFSQN